MNHDKQQVSKKLIMEALKRYRGLFNQKPSDTDLELYAEMLSGQFEFKQVTWALSEFVKRGSAFFPACGEIFSLLQPQDPKIEERAPVIVAEIIQAIRTYGKHSEKEMVNTLSPEARAVILQLGDTSDIRNSDNIETTKAQLERLAKGVLGRNVADIFNKKLETIGITETPRQLVDKNGLRQLNFTGENA
jgi:hypothetical protein